MSAVAPFDGADAVPRPRATPAAILPVSPAAAQPPAVVKKAPIAWREAGMTYGLPIGLALLVLVVWEWAVTAYQVPKFVLPTPSLIFKTLIDDAPMLFEAWQYTALISVGAFVAALVTGLLMGVVLAQSRIAEATLWPYAVILQVTPNFALAPLIIIWVGLDRTWLALLINAWLVAFFPILSNTVIGLKSADHGLCNIFHLYGSSRWKRFRYLQLPAALPFIMAGVKISLSLAVIGAIVAEFLAGSGTATGLGGDGERFAAQHPAHVRRRAGALALRPGHLVRRRLGAAQAAGPLARERNPAGKLIPHTP